jgi:hypothetical protein
MGYTKIIQYGNITEIYEYEKNINYNRKRYVSQNTKKRNRQILALSKQNKTYQRTKRSIQRTVKNFFRLCHHNNTHAKTIHFLTLTFAYDLSYKTALRHVSRFMERVAKIKKEAPLSYISVPELTKKGRYHFHLLVYNLSSEVAGTQYENEDYTTERETRNLQRLFERGYIDILPTKYTSQGLAGYMAKYMGKALTDPKNETTRGYNCSRNIKKITSAGGNSVNQFLEHIIPDNIAKKEVVSYNVPYMGQVIKTHITT